MRSPDSARPRLISDLHSLPSTLLINTKIRCLGRVLHIDALTGSVLLEHAGYSVLVDLSLALAGNKHLPDLKETVGVIGSVEDNVTSTVSSLLYRS